MVQSGDFCLDDLILQTFEEQEEIFHFPVRHQKDAKAFVRALNSKGLPYDALCEEIGEFEHNFTSWRKSLGRVGIGQRVMERINQPLQVLLDEDEPIEEYAAMKASKSNGLKPHADEKEVSSSKISTKHDVALKLEPALKHEPASNGVEKAPTPPLSPVKDTPDSPIRSPSSPKQEEHTKEDPHGLATPKLRHVVREDPTLEPELELDSDSEVKMTVAERINALNSGSPSPTRKIRDSPSREMYRAETESPKDSPVLPGHQRQPSLTNSLVSKFEFRSHASSTNSSMTDVSDVEKQEGPCSPKFGSPVRAIHPDNNQKTTEETQESPVSPVKENVTETSPEKSTENIEQDSCSDSGSETSGKLKSPIKSPNTLALTETNGDSAGEVMKKSIHSIDLKTPSPMSEDAKTPSPVSDDGKSLSPVEKDHTLISPTKELTSPTKEDPQDLDSTDTKSKLMETRKGSTDIKRTDSKRGNPESRKGNLYDVNAVSIDKTPSAIDENYNSDLDPENEDQSPVMAKLVQKISMMRGNTRNTAGFIYMFTDSPKDSDELRVKLGVSRCPDKRLLQAQLFNPEMRCLDTRAVNQRLTALNELSLSLAEYVSDDHTNWYEAPAEIFMESLRAISEKYASKRISVVGESIC